MGKILCARNAYSTNYYKTEQIQKREKEKEKKVWLGSTEEDGD
jgi:hypothetical protein